MSETGECHCEPRGPSSEQSTPALTEALALIEVDPSEYEEEGAQDEQHFVELDPKEDRTGDHHQPEGGSVPFETEEPVEGAHRSEEGGKVDQDCCPPDQRRGEDHGTSQAGRQDGDCGSRTQKEGQNP